MKIFFSFSENGICLETSELQQHLELGQSQKNVSPLFPFCLLVSAQLPDVMGEHCLVSVTFVNFQKQTEEPFGNNWEMQGNAMQGKKKNVSWIGLLLILLKGQKLDAAAKCYHLLKPTQ